MGETVAGDVAAVVGPGALGCLLAASLAEGGVATALVDHDPARAARLAARGLVVERADGALVAQLPVGAELPPEVEVVFLCVKERATAAALRPLVGGSATVAVLQNGCDRPAAVGALLGDPARVVGVTTSEGATLLGEGHVRHAGRGETQVGALEPGSAARAERVAALLQRAGWSAQVVADLRRASWGKLVVNAAINALTGLLGCENGALLRSPAAAALGDEAACEVAALARELGLGSGPGTGSGSGFQPEVACARWRAVALHTATNISSTLQDLRRGQATEVRAINGAVARLARERGLSAPINDALARLIQAREEVAQLGPEEARTAPGGAGPGPRENGPQGES
ncbi:MAG: ketopantoate reductase family protein [Planctomycetota bacterium]